MSIHIFKAMLQVKNSFKKRYITIKVKKVLKPIILLSYAVSKTVLICRCQVDHSGMDLIA